MEYMGTGMQKVAAKCIRLPQKVANNSGLYLDKPGVAVEPKRASFSARICPVSRRSVGLGARGVACASAPVLGSLLHA